MKHMLVATIAVLSASVAFAQQPAAPVEALDGIDTVILLKQGKEVFGRQDFRSQHGRFTYLFSSAETKAEFDKAPTKYAIQLGGACARMGGTVTGNPSDYFIHEGKIYIFGSDACHKAFAAAPEKYLAKPAAPMPADPAARTRGLALLDKATASLGGKKLDALTSYVDTSTETQTRPTGETRKVVTRNLWTFSGAPAARAERTMSMQGQTMSFGTLLTKDGAWGFGGPQMTRVIPEALPSVEQTFGRQLVPLLRSRRAVGTKVAALKPTTLDGKALERVRVRRGGLDVTLNIDAATGQVHSTSFVDRANDGQFGDITIVFSDFRPVEGLTLPFQETVLVNGKEEPRLSRKLDSIAVNSSLDAALFRGGTQ